MSASVQRQSVRPPPIENSNDGRINPRNSQRLRVLNETPIFLAACCVLQVFFIFFSLTRLSSSNTLIFPASQCHEFYFQASETIAHIIAAFLGEACEVWTVSVTTFCVPNSGQIF